MIGWLILGGLALYGFAQKKASASGQPSTEPVLGPVQLQQQAQHGPVPNYTIQKNMNGLYYAISGTGIGQVIIAGPFTNPPTPDEVTQSYYSLLAAKPTFGTAKDLTPTTSVLDERSYALAFSLPIEPNKQNIAGGGVSAVATAPPPGGGGFIGGGSGGTGSPGGRPGTVGGNLL